MKSNTILSVDDNQKITTDVSSYTFCEIELGLSVIRSGYLAAVTSPS